MSSLHLKSGTNAIKRQRNSYDWRRSPFALPVKHGMFSARAGFSLAICKKATPKHLNKQTDLSLKTTTFAPTSIELASTEKTLWQPLRLDPPKIGVTFGTECGDIHRQARDLPRHADVRNQGNIDKPCSVI
jgi:hypothetical protein